MTDREYKIVDLFDLHDSRGTFDDFYSTKKYSSIQEAREAEDYVQANFVIDQEGILYIEVFHVARPEEKKYHRLNYQRPAAGLDALDDFLGTEVAISLL